MADVMDIKLEDINSLNDEQKKAIKTILNAFNVNNSFSKNNNDTWESYYFELCSFNEYTGIFTKDIINKELLDDMPENMNHYDITHKCDAINVPDLITKNAPVNRYGTLLTYKKINFNDKNYKEIKHYYMSGQQISYKDYIILNRGGIPPAMMDSILKNKNNEKSVKKVKPIKKIH